MENENVKKITESCLVGTECADIFSTKDQFEIEKEISRQSFLEDEIKRGGCLNPDLITQVDQYQKEFSGNSIIADIDFNGKEPSFENFEEEIDSDEYSRIVADIKDELDGDMFFDSANVVEHIEVPVVQSSMETSTLPFSKELTILNSSNKTINEIPRSVQNQIQFIEQQKERLTKIKVPELTEKLNEKENAIFADITAQNIQMLKDAPPALYSWHLDEKQNYKQSLQWARNQKYKDSFTRIVSWNVGTITDLKQIVSDLKILNGDILCLQNVSSKLVTEQIYPYQYKSKCNLIASRIPFEKTGTLSNCIDFATFLLPGTSRKTMLLNISAKGPLQQMIEGDSSLQVILCGDIMLNRKEARELFTDAFLISGNLKPTSKETDVIFLRQISSDQIRTVQPFFSFGASNVAVYLDLWKRPISKLSPALFSLETPLKQTNKQMQISGFYQGDFILNLDIDTDKIYQVTKRLVPSIVKRVDVLKLSRTDLQKRILDDYNQNFQQINLVGQYITKGDQQTLLQSKVYDFVLYLIYYFILTTNQTERDVIVYRGVKEPTGTFKFEDYLLRAQQKNRLIYFPGLLSTALSYEQALQYSGYQEKQCCLFEIFVPKGSNGIILSKNFEFLFAPFLVMSVDQISENKLFYELRVRDNPQLKMTSKEFTQVLEIYYKFASISQPIIYSKVLTEEEETLLKSLFAKFYKYSTTLKQKISKV